MTSLTFFNTFSRSKEEIKTLEEGHLKMYVCGPTVYDRPHLGNARSIVIYDMMFRLFKEVFPKVTYVRNITDVDDKINLAAKNRNISIQQLTSEITKLFYDDISELNVLSPTFEPKATENIPEMISLVQKLIDNKHAYVSEGHVLFDVESYKDYGALSNRNIDEMISGSRVEIADYKKNPLDFVLWKPAAKDDDISSIFDSPWSKGRPGWHLECSAMSQKYLGENFDIHGGGADLQFPHHENEIAQSCCANPGSKFASFWIHNGFLTINGEKMSKSLKNFVTVRDLLDKDISGVVIRYLLLSTHYRKPFDFNNKALEDAKKSLEKFHSFIDESDIDKTAKIPEEFLRDLSDDLNIAKSTAFLHNLAKKIKANSDKNLKVQMFKCLDFLGLFDSSFLKKSSSPAISEDYVNEQIALRLDCKKNKNFAKADEIRNNLLEQGVVLEDISRDETIWKR